LLDPTWKLENGAAFVQLALDRTDHRVRTGRPNSPGFLFAALLWPLVRERWQHYQQEGQHLIQALNDASDEVILQQTRALPIQRRFQSDMRDIWFMQPRFEKSSPKAIRRMWSQPRFKAAVDFMQLRAEAKEVDSVLAQWWMDLANANDTKREDMLDALRGNKAGSGPAPAKRRSRR